MRKFKLHSLSRSVAFAIVVAGAGIQSAQALTGVVVDELGQPVVSAHVSVKGTSLSVLTDSEGVFNIDLRGKGTLLVEALGYQAIDYQVNNKFKDGDVIVVSQLVDPISNTLPGVYGEVDANSFIGAESTVYTEQLNRTMGATILPALTGKLAGLNISQYRGARVRNTDANTTSGLFYASPVTGKGIVNDNSEFNVYSRGMAPIVYVDGIERDFYSLDPDAIESVSIQKDALSTMFNGMRSSRPVLLITTKNPRNKGVNVSFTGRFGFSKPISTAKPLSSSQYAYMLNEALQNDGILPIYNMDDYYAFANGADKYLYPNVDWRKTIMRDNSTSQYYNVNVSGGNDFAQFFVNAGYYYENGLFQNKNAGYDTDLSSKRYSVDSKVNMNITKDFTATISLLARLEEGNQPGGAGNGYGDLLSDIYNTPNLAYPVKNPNGTWGGNVSFTNNLYAKAFESGYISDATRDLLGMIKLNYDFDRYITGLSVYAMGSIAVQSSSATFRTMRQPVYQCTLDEEGNYVYHRYGDISSQSNSYRSVGRYQQLWGRLGVNYERQIADRHNFKVGLSGDTRQNLHNYDLPSLPSNISETFGYNYDQKYFAQIALTQSYYNRYAKGNRWGNFYAAGLGWDIAKESFMESCSDWLDMLKIRAVYGRTGNGVDNSGYYNYYQTYSESGTSGYNWGTTYSDQIHHTSANTPLANPYITWEKADKWNVGANIELFKKRLLIQADYYNDKYFDILQIRGKSIGLLGTSYPVENIGRQRRSGGEISLTWQDNIGDFNYYINGNWNIEKSEILFMDEQNQPYDYLRHTGNSTGAIYGLVAEGFFSSMEEVENSAVIEGYDNIQPGDIKYRDMNGDGVIDDFDCVVIGGNKPLQYFGLNFGLNWKGIEFSMDWQGVYNRDIYINDRTLIEGFQPYGQSFGQAYELLVGRWTPETADTAILPRLSAGGNKYNMGGDYGSSFWVKNGNFIRCKNLYLGYTLPQHICRNYLGGVRPKLFVNVQNLCTISACNWVDPEVGFTSYPLQRTFSFGVNLKF